MNDYKAHPTTRLYLGIMEDWVTVPDMAQATGHRALQISSWISAAQKKGWIERSTTKVRVERGQLRNQFRRTEQGVALMNARVTDLQQRIKNLKADPSISRKHPEKRSHKKVVVAARVDTFWPWRYNGKVYGGSPQANG